MRKNLFISLLIVLIINFSGCQSDSNSSNNATYQKKNETLSIQTEPKSYRKYALVSSGNIEIKKSLSTDGPLADVYSNGEIKARSLSLDISGKITSSNNLNGSLVRSFDYTSPLGNNNFVGIRALKVDEYLNTNNLNEYYLLTNNGKAIHKIKDQDDKNIDKENIEFTFKNNSWIIKGKDINLNHTLVVQGNLKIESNYTYIAGTLMVQGDLNASGELNINTGTPFEKALIVDKNIEVNKFVAIGRVHGSGTFTAKGEVNILGNAEIDGDITLWGDAKINFLDNIYKSALYEAQGEASENNTTMMLVHSQLFSNAKGKNSVVLFTFVEGNYIINENIINQLIDTNQIDKFKFKSYLYGATIDYGAQLQKFDGLSPYFENKHKIFKKLSSQGFENIKISESLDIAPSNLYHTFKDKNDNIIGTYQVYSLSNPFDENNLTVLTQAQRDDAIYAIDHQDEIEKNQEMKAEEKQAEQKRSIIDNNDLNLTIKSQMLNEIEAFENNKTLINKEEVKKEVTQDRVQEWVKYRNLASDDKEVDVQNVVVDEATKARGWFSSFVRTVTKVFRVVTFTDCHKRTEDKRIWGVDSANVFESNDEWSKKIQLNNYPYDYCTPVSASMILNYHRLRKGKSSLYSDKGDWGDKSVSERSKLENNKYLSRIATKFHSRKQGGTYTNSDTSRAIQLELSNNDTDGYSWISNITSWNKVWHHDKTREYIKKNNPIMFNANDNYGDLKNSNNIYYATGRHSMAVIGYKREYYKGSCWEKVLLEKKWLLVDTTWQTRGYIRFDMRSNYWKSGSMIYVRSY